MRCRLISILDNDSFAEITIMRARGAWNNPAAFAQSDEKKRKKKKKEEEKMILREPRDASGRIANDH